MTQNAEAILEELGLPYRRVIYVLATSVSVLVNIRLRGMVTKL